ncbi:MAG: hypothetical protein L3K19_03455 [Thermoplasmata archaeon]|nr:hypothetical protein [Thermoplasmata archaeon]
MFDTMSLALVALVIGALALVAAWLLHWILLVAGVVLIALGVYLAFGGSLGPL